MEKLFLCIVSFIFNLIFSFEQDFLLFVANPRKQRLQIEVIDSFGFSDFTIGAGEVYFSFHMYDLQCMADFHGYHIHVLDNVCCFLFDGNVRYRRVFILCHDHAAVFSPHLHPFGIFVETNVFNWNIQDG